MNKAVWSNLKWGFVAALVLVGVVSRVMPLCEGQTRLFRQFASEDGYLMLTVARNVALGHGMSTAAGEIPTNGVQPLTSFVWAGAFWLVGGDRYAGMVLIHLFQMLIAGLSAWLLYRLGSRVLPDCRHQRRWLAALAAAIWFSVHTHILLGQNFLETGLYVFVLQVCMHLYLSATEDSNTHWSRWLLLGGVLGVAFWVRNDAVLFVGALCLVQFARGQRSRLLPLKRATAQCLWMGGISGLVALPWVVYNKVNFGYLMPISGVSESLTAQFAENIGVAIVALARYATVVLPVPEAYRTVPWVACVALVLVVIYSHCLIRLRLRLDALALARLIPVVIVYALLLTAFYGLYFGAGYFMERYLFPLTPFFTLFTVMLVAPRGTNSSVRVVRKALAGGSLCALLLLAIALNVRVYHHGTNNGHFQVVEWVEQNVSDESWVAAVQTGTLGFFHDRTINLDGKVNPYALEARLTGTVPEMLVESPVDFVVDWAGIASWADLPELRHHFFLIVEDKRLNLSVLKRR